MSILAQIFDDNDSLHILEKFTSINGAKHYSQNLNKKKIKMIKKNSPIKFNSILSVNNKDIVIFKPNFPVYWEVED